MSRDLELEKKIDAYIKGGLTEEEAQKLWEELLKRPDYIELLKTELAVKAIFEKQSSGAKNKSSKNSKDAIIHSLHRSWKWMATAAAVAILVVAVNIFQIDTSQNIKELAQRNFNLTDNLSSAQIMRNQKMKIPPSDSLLNRGFEAAISGEIAQAIKMYNKIIEKYGDTPAAAQAYLNKGIIQYNNGDFGESIESFKSVLKKVKDRVIIEEKAHWYLGNAYINIEQLKDARSEIHKVYSMDGIYRKPAFRLLKKLDYELGNIDFDNFEQQMNEG